MRASAGRFERKRVERAVVRPVKVKKRRSTRKTLLWMLWLLPVLMILGAFAFGVSLQSLMLVPAAKQGGVLGGLASVALSILIVALLCMPGYLVAVVWWTWASRGVRDDPVALKRLLRLLPVVGLAMSWLPAVIVPKIELGIRLQVAGVMVFMTLLFGFLWVAAVRLLLAFLTRAGWVRD